MSLQWSDNIEELDWEELAALYRAAPLGTKNAADLKTAFSNSRYRCLVREDGRLIGAGRVLADGVDCAYVCDVALLPSHQGLGLGREIVQHLVRLSQGHKKIILYSVPGKEPFYRKLGFRRLLTAMAIFENEAQAIARGHLAED